ncbi:MarR family winged helix-turn-helix transcriptional regulator [Nocardia sp. 004]|uniref:MarR family winged helix-turn-helix transcriptional regulator n=1 Tax=Nocardia sp. 004 TaxID=3385978 RepID=UPI0039A2B3CF
MSNERERRDQATEIIGLFAAINRRYAQEAEAAASAHGLTLMQAKALLAAQEPIVTRRIADQLHAEPSNITAIIDKLQERGLVERRLDPDDRRVRLIAATEEGKRVGADLRARMPFAGQPLRRLDDNQRAQLRDLLAAMLAE